MPFVVNLLQCIMMICVSNSFFQKTPSEIGRLLLCYKRFLAVTQKRGNCFFVNLACNKLFSILGTEIIIQPEHEKQFKSQILKQTIFTVPALESENWQNIRFRPNIYTTCQNLNWKKTRVLISFEINFLFVRFLFVFWFRNS